MRICYLHIGPPKSGSTTIQAFLDVNAAALADEGLYVPDMSLDGRRKFHQHLALELGAGEGTAHRERLAGELRRMGYPTRIVISSEKLALSMRSAATRQRIGAYFAGLGYALHVVSYVRPQIGTINSAYIHHVRASPTPPSFDDYFERFIANPRFEHGWLHRPMLDDASLRATLVPLARAAGAGWLCSDFLGRLGLEGGVLKRLTIPEPQNVSPGPKTVAVLACTLGRMQRLGISIPRHVQTQRAGEVHARIAALGGDAGKFNGLSEDRRSRLLARFAADNERFARRVWGAPWREFFGPEEDDAMRAERCVFDPEAASPAERTAFDSLCETAFAILAAPVSSELKR